MRIKAIGGATLFIVTSSSLANSALPVGHGAIAALSLSQLRQTIRCNHLNELLEFDLPSVNPYAVRKILLPVL
jgi:hypothetical protein